MARARCRLSATAYASSRRLARRRARLHPAATTSRASLGSIASVRSGSRAANSRPSPVHRKQRAGSSRCSRSCARSFRSASSPFCRRARRRSRPALITGARAAISHDDLVALQNSGLLHILSISGLHLALVAGLVMFVVRGLLALIEPVAVAWPVKKIAAVAALGASGFYVCLSDGDVATMRSFLMLAVAIVARPHRPPGADAALDRLRGGAHPPLRARAVVQPPASSSRSPP